MLTTDPLSSSISENPENSDNNVINKMNTNDDSCFLLHFIMGTYFGPDLKEDETKKSALQRIAEGLPPYTQEHLQGSHIRTSEIELIYYFLLRSADRSLTVKLPLLHQFIQGQYPSEGEGFLTLFPPHLHPQTESLNRSRLVADVVFIRNPATFYIQDEDIDRFKRLARLEKLFIDNDTVAKLLNSTYLDEEGSGNDDRIEEVPILNYYRGCQKKRRLAEIMGTANPKPQLQNCNGAAKALQLALPSSAKQSRSDMRYGPGIVILPSQASRDELKRIGEIVKNAYAVTGSAAKGHIGSVIGLMDIEESEDSYLFRVALPGVKRENRAFQCEVESDGRVQIKGETVTGEKKVYRHSETFIMQTQNLCPSGPFSISFQLPGPVDPRQFSGRFGTDAILEGIVMKRKPST
ncbi:increased DNA methylation 2-like isoform X1 [Amaranthus tricolor]|uniref:increased DNA methylation 2-like isoform X1 n=2 Tax=Amaranthus tricolor TaxID=29722 RepID=UPI00258C7880|nr:increased DNA methylation 2-like isoform X1 [Amaranthus tricolor]